MEEIIKELNSATEYLRAIKKIGHNKEDCDNILMHLANIEELVYKLFIAKDEEELIIKFIEKLDYSYNYKTVNERQKIIDDLREIVRVSQQNKQLKTVDELHELSNNLTRLISKL